MAARGSRSTLSRRPPEQLVEQAIALATAAIGPAWRSTPPAAPAKVTVLDPVLATIDLAASASALLSDIKRPVGTTVATRIEIVRELVTVTARSGFHEAWPASTIRAEALVIAAERSLMVSREARRLGDLGFDLAVAGAAADLHDLASAELPRPGSCALVLASEAMLHGGLGVWSVFASQADPVVERQGLTRYHLGSRIAPNADQIFEPLTIESDGALEFGTRSARVGDDGDAVRRFPLVDRGIAAGLGLSPREAALRHRDPNGGVRNLVVAAGSWSGPPPPGTGRVLELRRLQALAIDPYTGNADLEIALATDRATGRSFAGGTVRLDLIAALARARRSGIIIQRGAYRGPDSVLIEDVEVLA